MIDAAKATWPEIAERLEHGLVAVMATGAQEQHGHHLPLSTDTLIAGELARRLAEAIDAVLLPPLPYGETWTAEGFAGTLSLTPETLEAVVYDLGCNLHRMGAKAFVIVNGHFGNQEPVARAARRLYRDGLPVLYLNHPGLPALAEAVCDSAPAAPTFYHADEVETSAILAIAPESVRMSRAAAEYPRFPNTFFNRTMPLHQVSKSGVFGDPRPASSEKGKALLGGLHSENVRLAEQFLDEIAKIIPEVTSKD